MTTRIWKLKNIVLITEMSIEGTAAAASLAAAITVVLVATEVLARSKSLVLIDNFLPLFCIFTSPTGIAVLFITAVYFAAAAYASYQQMHKNEEISEAKAGAESVS